MFDLRKWDENYVNNFYYILGSIVFGSLLALAVIYLNTDLFGMRVSLFFFLLLAVPSIAMVFAALTIFRLASQAEHSKAKQSYQILEITRRTLPYLRKGLNAESASEVINIIHRQTDAVAVSITDRTTILGFRGVGEDHHLVGKPILTRATKDSIETDTTRVLGSKAEIGCPMVNCKLKAAVVVPLEKTGKAVGSLKFYYDNPKKLTESRIAVAEGLGQLLSTQIELSELERQRELTYHAELRALQAQINPHFLFNTLNTITAFIRTDPRKARKLLVQFSDFFRKSLEWKDVFITLAQELDYIANYLVLEKARFGDRLDISFDIDNDAQECILPALTIQPLVENAVKHGFCEERELEISIIARLADNNMQITVADNGRGISEEDLDQVIKFGYGKGSGIGLSNVNERLRSIYGEDYQVKIESTLGVGTRALLNIPISRSKENETA
ncbi:MAG: sensor histidine kinase [Candidatus Aquicultor secundus]|uniref:histidine kinase n=2 Tax=Candidatus Aquicultor secundus TaxID=1973895 RepID=UPI000CC43372|nr:histidine kinase [Candidatus Aquicultor secundus]NCO66269.1 sensor histidine kinase [Solirubrobacter sp.]PIW21770.1 MAG: sensor histidine kinase [Candidatus Aquicultor secundus]PIX53208.1 MAG: sensor histidine kinase [Candidatus Aquicultor secundus]PIY38331.1 MAG: sensor histidine kinase [Candidatus Aquicultor secundus]PJB80379.1 MAG: sensor histidine kinase [Candidatus Aquicultor secundus]